MLNQGPDFHELHAKLPAFIEKYEGKALRSINSWEEFYLQPIHDIHLHSDLKGVAKSACGKPWILWLPKLVDLMKQFLDEHN